MEILWANLFVVYISAFFARYFSTPLIKSICDVRPNRILITLSMVSLVLVSGLRNNIGDTYFYMHSYIITDFSWSNFRFEADFGFNILQLLLQSYSNDPQILIFVTALLTNILIVIILNRYSRRIELSLYIFITSGMYTVSMNGIRQFLAAAIVFTSTKYLLEGEFKKFLLVIFIASTIHQSALIFIPIYFIVRQRAWTKMTFNLLGIGVILALGFSEFSKLLFVAIENTKYAEYSNFDEGGSSLLRVVVGGVPLLFAYLGRDKFRHLWDKSDYIVNLSILSLLILIVSTQNWIFARFNIYFGLYNLILISWIVSLFKEGTKKTIYYCILFFYLGFFYYEQVIALNIIYESDYIKW